MNQTNKNTLKLLAFNWSVRAKNTRNRERDISSFIVLYFWSRSTVPVRFFFCVFFSVLGRKCVLRCWLDAPHCGTQEVWLALWLNYCLCAPSIKQKEASDQVNYYTWCDVLTAKSVRMKNWNRNVRFKNALKKPVLYFSAWLSHRTLIVHPNVQ